MRFTRVLDWVFHGAGVLSALFLAAIALLTFIQIVGRMMGYLISTGTELAGFCMAASIFLALAWTLRSGGHIRVTLFIQHLPPRWRHGVEIWCLTVAALAIGFFAYSAFGMMWDSYQFGDVSVGIIVVPLWIPQAAMAVGVLLMEAAVVEQLVKVLLGQDPVYQALEDGGTPADPGSE